VRWLTRARASLRDDSGLSLPEVMVSVVVSMACMGVIAGGIVTLISVGTQAAGAAAASSEQQRTEARWRSDVRSAVAVEAMDSKHVTFTAPGSDGTCVESAWAIDASTTAVTIHTLAFPAMDAGSCTGEPSSDVTLNASPVAGEKAVFTQANAAGRTLVFDHGTIVADATPAPAGVAAEDWNSTTIAIATIDFEAMSGTEWATPYSVSQQTGDTPARPDAPTHHIDAAPVPTPTPTPETPTPAPETPAGEVPAP
jgi:Tfp pilus assembly protein PilV